MKAITLTQPWATLVAIGAKTIETRSWSTTYRGPLAIHAAKGKDKTGAVVTVPFWSVLKAAGLDPLNLPLGAVVATCTLFDCVDVDLYMTMKRGRQNGPFAPLTTDDEWTVPPGNMSNEYAFGDYSSGRFAWLLADVRLLSEPLPARGALGLWDWPLTPPVVV